MHMLSIKLEIQNNECSLALIRPDLLISCPACLTESILKPWPARPAGQPAPCTGPTHSYRWCKTIWPLHTSV